MFPAEPEFGSTGRRLILVPDMAQCYHTKKIAINGAFLGFKIFNITPRSQAVNAAR